MIENRVESLSAAAIRSDGVGPDIKLVQGTNSIGGVQKNVALPEYYRVEPWGAIRKQ